MSAEYKQVISGNSGTLNKSKLSSASALKRICGDQMRLQPLVRADLVQLALICPGLRVYDFLGECVSDRGGGGSGGVILGSIAKTIQPSPQQILSNNTHTHTQATSAQTKKKTTTTQHFRLSLSIRQSLFTHNNYSDRAESLRHLYAFFFFFPRSYILPMQYSSGVRKKKVDLQRQQKKEKKIQFGIKK